MNPRDRLVEKLDRMLLLLERPLDADDRLAGWSDELHARWRNNFSVLRAHVLAGRPLNPEYRAASTARAMDFSGLCDGKLVHLAAEIDCDVIDALAEETRETTGATPLSDAPAIDVNPEAIEYVKKLLSERWPDGPRQGNG